MDENELKKVVSNIKKHIDTDKDGKIESHEIQNFLRIWGGYFFTSVILLSLYYEDILKTMFASGSLDFAFIWKNIIIAGFLGVIAKMKMSFNNKTNECLSQLTIANKENKELREKIIKMKHCDELMNQKHKNELDMLNEQHKIDLMTQNISNVSKGEIAKIEIAKNN